MAQKIEHIQGDTFDAEVIVKDKVGAPVSLAGVSISWKIAAKPTALEPILSKTVGNGVVVIDAEAGKFSLALTAEETGGLPAGDYFHTVRLTFQDGRVKTILREYLSILETF